MWSRSFSLQTWSSQHRISGWGRIWQAYPGGRHSLDKIRTYGRSWSQHFSIEMDLGGRGGREAILDRLKSSWTLTEQRNRFCDKMTKSFDGDPYPPAEQSVQVLFRTSESALILFRKFQDEPRVPSGRSAPPNTSLISCSKWSRTRAVGYSRFQSQHLFF